MNKEGTGTPLTRPAGDDENFDPVLNGNNEASLSLLYSACVKDDDVYAALRRHFYKEGKGRPPDLPKGLILTNRLLLQLYFLKEEKQCSFHTLKSWLEKLVPDTSTVTEGRIRHRISTLLSSTSTDCLHVLEEELNFHALTEPLEQLGLTRLHLTGASEFKGISLPSISNSVVIALENFRSQNREPTTFVNKWLNILCTTCKNLTAKQLKRKVEKAVQRSKVLSRKRDYVGLKEFHDCPFLEDNSVSQVTTPKTEKCQQCLPVTKENKEKRSIIKGLEQENKNLTSQLSMQLEINATLNQDKIKIEESQKNIQDMNETLKKQLNLKNDGQKSIERENLELKSKTNTMEMEIKTLKDKSRTYKNNFYLRKECEDLKVKAHKLESEVVKLKEDALFEKVSTLKRKVISEQAQKSKLKSKLRKLEDSLVDYVESDDDDNPLVSLREDQRNKFKSNVRLTYMALQGEADIPATKCSKVVDIVSHHLHGKKLTGLPCVKTALNMADEGHHVAKQQIADELLKCNHFTFSSDGTSRDKQHYMERHVTLDDGTELSLGFTEIASDDAKSMLEQAIDVLEEITTIHCTSQSTSLNFNVGDKIDEVMIEILKKIKSMMSDRAANMKAFDRLFYEYKKEKLGPDDASTLFLFCNAHFLLGLSAGAEKALRVLEDEMSTPGTSFDIQPLFFKEQATLGVIRCASDAFGPRGDEKNGCREEWLMYCKKFNIASKFCSYRSNRFNNLFENAHALIFHKDHILDFLKNYCNTSNLKLKGIHDALLNKHIAATVLSLAILNVIITEPYWQLMNSNKPYSEFPKLVKKMDVAFMEWLSITDPEMIATLQPLYPVSSSKICLDFRSELTSDGFNITTFVKAFSYVLREMQLVMKRQLKDFLDGGIFGGDIPADMKKILDKCPLTNLTGERLFGDFDYDTKKRRHCSTHHRSTLNMWKRNKTATWLQEKDAKEKERILLAAHKDGKHLKDENREAVEREKVKGMKRLEEYKRKKDKKESNDLQQKNQILDAILQRGFCNTIECLNEIMKNGTVEDLKYQVKYRKIFLNEKGLKTTGTKKQLYESLQHSIASQND